jgi:predicted metal-binding membrane protein
VIVKRGRESPAALQRRVIRTPVLIIAGLAWIATTVVGPMALTWHADGSAMNMQMGGSAHNSMMNQMSMPASPSPGLTSGFGWMWLLMLTAMMSPLLIAPLRHVSERSLSRRRARAMLLFLVPYVAIWTLGGFALEETAVLISRLGLFVLIVLAAAIVWQLSPARQRCLNRHHARPPVAAFGNAADLDAARFGAGQALWCVGSCWFLMLLPLLYAAGSVAAMACVSLWIWAEIFEKPRRPTWSIRFPVVVPRLIGGALPKRRPSGLAPAFAKA